MAPVPPGCFQVYLPLTGRFVCYSFDEIVAFCHYRSTKGNTCFPTCLVSLWLLLIFKLLWARCGTEHDNITPHEPPLHGHGENADAKGRWIFLQPSWDCHMMQTVWTVVSYPNRFLKSFQDEDGRKLLELDSDQHLASFLVRPVHTLWFFVKLMDPVWKNRNDSFTCQQPGKLLARDSDYYYAILLLFTHY